MTSTLPQLSHTLTPEKKILVGVDVLAAIDPDILEDSYVYVHCQFPIQTPGMLIRIWKTTVLKDCHSSGQSQLVHAENISYAPQWTMIPDTGTYSFLLIFSALPKSCTQFDLVEEIPQAGGFLVKNIQRNKTDVYRITIE
ncbi:hypothetical protein WSM22_31670 [Cytophagales bacterium WSM2-2]|nr:hypothetical protein WSM22_31670 [Cytophagales bacterium WSM2-2]